VRREENIIHRTDERKSPGQYSSIKKKRDPKSAYVRWPARKAKKKYREYISSKPHHHPLREGAERSREQVQKKEMSKAFGKDATMRVMGGGEKSISEITAKTSLEE